MILITLVLITILWIYFYMDVNARFPAYEEKTYKIGETSKIKGIDMVVTNFNEYTMDEFLDKYSEFESVFDLHFFDDYKTEGKYILFVVDVDIKNSSDSDISFGKEDINQSNMVIGDYSNGLDANLTEALNPEYTHVFKKKSTTHLTMVYSFSSQYIKDCLGKEDVEFIFSYYPTKEYYVFDKNLY